jgi:hypothetical protein
MNTKAGHSPIRAAVININNSFICSNLGVNEKGHLTMAGYDTVELAKQFGTPLYVLDEGRIRRICAIMYQACPSSSGELRYPCLQARPCPLPEYIE